MGAAVGFADDAQQRADVIGHVLLDAVEPLDDRVNGGGLVLPQIAPGEAVGIPGPERLRAADVPAIQAGESPFHRAHALGAAEEGSGRLHTPVDGHGVRLSHGRCGRKESAVAADPAWS
jgi:hypothetical protein